MTAFSGKARAGVFFTAVLLLHGCSILSTDKTAPISQEPEDLEEYKLFIRENIIIREKIYSKEYRPCEYMVETDDGVRLLQSLIDTGAVEFIADSLKSDNLSQSQLAQSAFQYIRDRFKYFPMPESWPDTASILKTGQGDCKGLSLLLMALLKVLDIEHYGAVSNGHMWVNALLNDQWVVFETDADPDRNQVYRIKGFYDFPMFKIYHHGSQKRMKKLPAGQN